MSTLHTRLRTLICAVWPVIVLLGCSDDPQALMSSAKDYLAKNDNKAAVIQLKNVLQTNPELGEARLLLGKALLESGNPVAAEIELRKAVELKVSADQTTPLLARTQLMLGQPRKVIDDLAKVNLSEAGPRADLQTSVGLAYLMTGKIDDAQTAFDAAIAAVANYAPALIGQARIKAARQDLPGALTLLSSTLEKSPNHPDAWQLKGDILTALGKDVEAQDSYRQAVALKADYAPAYASLISHLLKSGKVDDAAKLLEAMKHSAPGSVQLSYLQAQLFYSQKNFKAALDSIQQYLNLIPDSAPALQLAGAIAFELKSYATAETYLQKALPKTAELGAARRVLIATYLRSGQPAKALATLQPVLDKIGDDSNMLALAGAVFLQVGEVDKSTAYFAKSAALDPANKNKLTSVALARLANGEEATAYRELEQIASGDSGTHADMALISSLLTRRKFDQALKAIATLEKKQPENPLVDNLRGTALLGMGDQLAARKSFERALTKNATYFPAVANLARLDFAEKKIEDAKKRFEALIAKEPKNVQALVALAGLRVGSGGKTEEAAALLERAIAAGPNEPSPRLALIDMYLAAKDATQAVSVARDALAVLPGQPELLDASGRAYLAAGDSNQALVAFGRLASLLPNSPQPQLRMAEAYLAAKNKDAARQSLRKALAIKSDMVDAQRGIMALDLDAGRTADALNVAREIQRQRPKQAVGYMLEGDVQVAKKAWSDAVAAYRTAIRQSGSLEPAVKLHSSLLAGGNSGEAKKFADGWLVEHAKDLVFRNYLAELASLRKDYATANKHYRVLLDARPSDPMLLNNIAWNLGQLKDPQALEYAQKAYALAPNQPAIMDTLGVLLVEKGETERGVELLQKAIGGAPNAASIRLNLAKALLAAGKKDAAKKELDQLARLGDKFPAQAEVSRLMQGL